MGSARLTPASQTGTGAAAAGGQQAPMMAVIAPTAAWNHGNCSCQQARLVLARAWAALATPWPLMGGRAAAAVKACHLQRKVLTAIFHSWRISRVQFWRRAAQGRLLESRVRPMAVPLLPRLSQRLPCVCNWPIALISSVKGLHGKSRALHAEGGRFRLPRAFQSL